MTKADPTQTAHKANGSEKDAQQVTVENVNTPGRRDRLRADKYNEMRSALMSVIPEHAPGLPFSEILSAAKLHLSQELFPEGKTSGWWAKTVQLDLEAKGLITRQPGKPLTFFKRQGPA